MSLVLFKTREQSLNHFRTKNSSQHRPGVSSVWKVKVAQSCLTLCDPMDWTVHGILQARTLEWVAVPFSRGSSQPRDWIQVSHCRWILYRLSLQGSPRILEWVAYTHLQKIFLTQYSNWGLLHCRWILYQLSYQGIPMFLGGLLCTRQGWRHFTNTSLFHFH